MDTARACILFLCTGNSARSILAEAIAGRVFGLAAKSAGSTPKGRVHELALATLGRHGIDTSGLRSKSWDEVRREHFDLVLTLCDQAAAEGCPAFPGAPVQRHWSLPDPPASHNPAATFEAVYGALTSAIGHLADTHEPDLGRRADAGLVAIRVALRDPAMPGT